MFDMGNLHMGTAVQNIWDVSHVKLNYGTRPITAKNLANRAGAAGWACVVFRGRPLHELAVMDFAVVYGRRSGRRLAMAGSTGVHLE